NHPNVAQKPRMFFGHRVHKKIYSKENRRRKEYARVSPKLWLLFNKHNILGTDQLKKRDDHQNNVIKRSNRPPQSVVAVSGKNQSMNQQQNKTGQYNYRGFQSRFQQLTV